MKTLIQNYTSALSTEPMYINKCLNECGGQSVLWSDPSVSAFDAFDHSSPDLTNDVVKYLSQNKKIQMVLNVSGAQQAELDQVDSLLEGFGVNIPLVFSNAYQANTVAKTKKVKFINLFPAADIFLAPIGTPAYSIDTCVVGIQNSDLVQESIKGKKTYHIFSLNPEADYADMSLDITGMTSFYNKYKTVVLADDLNVVTSQLLFDGMLRANKINIKVPENQKDNLDKILALLFVESPEKKDIADILRDQIKSKHNCFNRVARLLRSLGGVKDIAQKMEDISSKL